MKKLKTIFIFTVFLHLLFYTGYVVAAGIHPDCCAKEMSTKNNHSSCCETEEPPQNYAEDDCCETIEIIPAPSHDQCCELPDMILPSEQTLTQCDCIHLFDTDYSFLQTNISQDNTVQQYPAEMKYYSGDDSPVNTHSKYNDFRLKSDYHPDLCICNCTLLI